MSSKEVDLTCTAHAVAYVDTTTGLKWEPGQTHRVSSKDAKRIMKAVPQCNWESVAAVGDPPSAIEAQPYQTTKRAVRVIPENETPGFEVH